MKKIESIVEYQQLASRTCPDLGSDDKNIKHMHMGIITEVAETLDVMKKHLAYKKPLDIVNIGEELADTTWYLANENRMFSKVLWTQEEFEQHCQGLDQYLIDTPDCILNQDTVDEFLASVIPFEYGISDADLTIKDVVVLKKIAEFYELDFYQILTNNIEKLQIRYPEKFTEEAAINRDTDAERVVLEKTESSEN